MRKITKGAAYALVLAFVALSVAFTSCSKSGSGGKKDADSLQVKTFIDQAMKQYYYWADQMPSSVEKKGKSVENYFNALLVKKDRWSWMMNGQSYNSMETGISTSYGFHIAQPIDYFGDYDVYIRYVDKNSPLAKAGITRGCQLTKINGTDVETLIRNDHFYDEIYKTSNKFTFKKPSGDVVELNLNQSSFQSNSVALAKVFTAADCDKLSKGAKVGYILYTSFSSSMKNEIVSALQQMKSDGITDLILDLRYNGGGDLDLCADIASLLAPASADGKVFVTLEHNLANRKEDHSYNIKRSANSFDLGRLFIITGDGTASASESMINCLRPYMDVQTVGLQTHGKPNGMYVFLYPQKVAEKDIEYAFLPICFYCVNSEGKADYDNGIAPTNKRYDDLYHDFSGEEDLIKACLLYIASGKYPGLPEKAMTKSWSRVPGIIHLDDGFKGAYVKKH
ncbi:MAG: hypothetical protein J6X91_04755 [Bacteroidales bacterium]|nr:hypothetical protein [Bacteroidales bacterium]MBP5517949.1 hypothetical protein [Bacteroidales bacterium]